MSFTIFSLFVIFAQLCNGEMPEMVLYNERGATTPSYIAKTNIESVDQACLPSAIKATRICVNNGTWLLYPDTAYHYPPELDVLIVIKSVDEPNPFCRDLPAWINRQVGSFRFAGDPNNVAASSLNLYVGLGYKDAEKKLNSSATELPFAFNSLIRTGADRWQFFMKENYSGLSECLNEDETTVPDFKARFGVEPGDIKSIRKICDKPYTKRGRAFSS